MFFSTALYSALTLFGIGLISKVSRWFRFSIGIGARKTTVPERISAAFKGLLSAICRPAKLLQVFRVFFADVLFQARILKKGKLRWLMHMLIFTGFMFLLFTHAFRRFIDMPLYDRYYLALNPFLLFSGLLVLSGTAVAAWRRLVLNVPRLNTNAADISILGLLAVIIVSGILMEGTKLTSYDHYTTFWYVHILACFTGLACLPFTKMLHVFTTPASLLANAVMDGRSDPANIMTRQVMELDACTQCGTCSSHCSVSVAFDCIGNGNILPSERIRFLKDYIAGKPVDAGGFAAIREGICLCTNCDRCTAVCPAGINLRELWFRAREAVIQHGHCALVLTPFSFYRGLNRQEIDPKQYDRPLEQTGNALAGHFGVPDNGNAIALASENPAPQTSTALSADAGTYAFCFTCRNCSMVCPVVGAYEDPQEMLDLLPHQIIRSVAFGLEDLAMGSGMLWNCLTCYQCQEHCPQGVAVTDIFYELKNQAVKETGRCSGSNPNLMNTLLN